MKLNKEEGKNKLTPRKSRGINTLKVASNNICLLLGIDRANKTCATICAQKDTSPISPWKRSIKAEILYRPFRTFRDSLRG